jgi:hypothetical protein
MAMAGLAQSCAPQNTYGEADRWLVRSVNVEERNAQLVETRQRCMVDLKVVVEVDERRKEP